MDSGDPFPLLDVLTKYRVPFVIIGGHAVSFHGYVRATEDLDIVFRRTPQSEESLFAALTEVRARWIGSEVDPATGLEVTYPVTLPYLRASRVMMLITDVGFLDIFDFVPGYPDESVERLFESAVEGLGWRFVSLAWLRKMKQATGRPKDTLDLGNLPESS